MRRSMLVLLTGSALGLLTPGCATVHDRGTRALEQEDVDTAEQHARRAMEQAPDDPRSHLLMARVHVAKNQLYDALPYGRRAFDSPPLKVEAGRLLGKIYWDLAQPVDAAQAWYLTRLVDPEAVGDEDFVRALEAALTATTLAQDHERALHFRTLLSELVSDHSETSTESFRLNRERLATEFVHVGRLEEAVNLYDNLLDEFPDRPFYALEKGQILLRLDRRQEATETWQHYVDAFDEGRRLQRLLEVAQRAEQLGAPPTALVFYRQAMDQMETEEVSFRQATLRLRIAGLLFTDGQIEAGRDQILAYTEDMRKLRGLPLSAEVYVTGAETALNHQQAPLAFELLEEGLTEAPASWRLTQLLAELYAHRAQTTDLERVLATYVERADSQVDAELHAARWTAGRRNHELARHYYLRAVQHPSSAQADIWLELARLYAATNQPDDLRDALQSFLRLRDNHRQALIDAAALFMSQRLFEDAERVLKVALRQEPTALTVVDRLANLYIEWERVNDVRDLFDGWIRARGNRTADIQLVADRFLRQGHHDEARHYYERAANAGELGAWLQLADILRSQRRDADMKIALERYLEASPERPRALREVLGRYRSNFMLREAAEILTELIELEPRHWSHWEQLAEIYLENGQDTEAINLLRRYMQASGRQLEALDAIGRRLEQRGHGRWLVGFYEELLAGGESEPLLLRMLGDAYFTASQYGPAFDIGATESLEQANYYYRRYIEESSLTPAELSDFAGQLRHRRIWPSARLAYEKLLHNRPPSGQTLVHYGAVLLQLGEIARAEEAFATHYQMRGKDPQEGRNIAQHLFTFHRYEAAEPYLLDLFESDSQDHLHQSYSILAEIYRNSDQPERLAKLTTRFLERAQNRTRARQTILTILENSGLWKETIEQIERIHETGPNTMDWTLGQSHFRLGNTSRAQEIFERFAESSPDQASAWILVGQFYETRAYVEEAAEAYDRAIRQQPDNPMARMNRGRLHLLRGELDAGLADFDHIFRVVDGPQTHEYRAALAEILQDIGHFAKARQVARESLVHAPYERDFLLRLIAQEDLDTDDPARIDQAVANLRQQGMTLNTLVRLLDAFGHGEWAVAAIEDELSQGDQDQGLRVLLDHIELFPRHGGVDRLRDAVAPLLDEGQGDTGRLTAILGNFYVREGLLEEGVLHLQAAIDQGYPQLLPLLAHTLALMGRHQEAHARFQHHLARVQPQLLIYELRVLAMRYEFLGQADELLELLRHLARDMRFAHEAAPLWLVYTLEETGDVYTTLDLLRATSPYRRLMASSESSALLRPETLVVVRSLEAIASRGFVEEIREALAELPESARTSDAVRALDLRLAALDPDGGAGAIEAELARLDATQSGNVARLNLARKLLINGHPDRARTIALELLDAPDRVVAAQALEVALSAAMVQDDKNRLEGDLERFIITAADKQLGRAVAADHLSRLGLDDAQLRLRHKSAAMMATESNVTATFNAAVMTGDAAHVKEHTDAVLRIAEDPVAFLKSFTANAGRLEPELVDLTLTPIHRAFPALLETRQEYARSLWRRGEVDESRALLLEYLQSVDFERTAVEWIFASLVAESLHVEVARFFGPRVPAENLTPNALRYLGQANLAIGFDEPARDYFERYLDRSSDRAQAAVELARQLQESGHYRPSLSYAELAVELRPDRPDGYLYRGIARHAAGRTEDATADIDHALTQGVGKMLALYRAADAALYAGQEEVALTYLARLARTPMADGYQVLYPLRLALSVFDDGKHARTGARFLREHYPRIADGAGVARTETATFSSGLFERAGKSHHAYAIYEGAIFNERVRSPLDPALPTYLNNLAYTYSTTNQHVDRGLDMVRRAIAASEARSAAYIDTLGWLYYRAGDYPRAEAEVRRAIRSSGGSPLELKELYHHLAELLELQGRYEEAVWIRIYVSRI